VAEILHLPALLADTIDKVVAAVDVVLRSPLVVDGNGPRAIRGGQCFDRIGMLLARAKTYCGAERASGAIDEDCKNVLKALFWRRRDKQLGR
jgi:hypothetical protein